jgi:hypothetical protein
MKQVTTYAIYEPPAPDLPYLGVLFVPGSQPRVFIFKTYQQAKKFLTDHALQELE